MSLLTPKNRKLEQLKSAQRMPIRRSINDNSFVAEPPNQDDENERSRRRSMAHMRRSISNNASTPTAEHPPAAVHEIKEHINICLKMFMENKITSKNAWNIKIIDYMHIFLQSSEENKDSLQVGSTSLDVGAKVYSIRVDDVHSTGLKLASTMSKSAQKDHRNNESGGDEAECPERADGAKKTAKKKKKFVTGGIKHTIAKNIDTLLADVPKLDSAFFQTKSNAELSVVDNFLTNRIPMDKSGCMFTLMSKETMWTTEDDVDHSLSDRTFKLKKPTLDKVEICPDLCGFEVDVWDPDNDEMSLRNNTELVFDDNGIPMAELDGSIHDIFNEPDHVDYGSSEEDQEPEHIAVLGNVTNINNLRPSSEFEPSDYAYQSIMQRNKCMTNIWAGPSHWKFKHIQPAASRYSGATEKKVAQKRRPKDKNMIINFLEEKLRVDENESVPKKKITVKPWPETNKFCIRVGHAKNIKTLHSFLLKPAFTAHGPKHSENNNHSDGHEVTPYDYENPNDSIYCSQNPSDDHHDDGTVDEEDVAAAGQNQAYRGENLIDIPEMVQTDFISYASRAKKMDMKKLKASIWKVLIDDTDNKLVTDEMYEKQVVKVTKFSDVYRKLPTILNKSMKEELSSPLAFMALLHLANEQTLELTGLRDFTIKAAAKP